MAGFWDQCDDLAAAPSELRLAAAAEVIRHLKGADRRRCEQHRLLRLKQLVCPDTYGRAAAQRVTKVLEKYRRSRWSEERGLGHSLGRDMLDEVCFEVLLLSSGRLGNRKLQAIFADVRPRAQRLSRFCAP